MNFFPSVASSPGWVSWCWCVRLWTFSCLTPSKWGQMIFILRWRQFEASPLSQKEWGAWGGGVAGRGGSSTWVRTPSGDGSQLPAAATQQTPMWIMHQVFTPMNTQRGCRWWRGVISRRDHGKSYLERSSSQHVEQLQSRRVDTVDLSERISL